MKQVAENMRVTDNGVCLLEIEKHEYSFRLAKGEPCFDITVFVQDGLINRIQIGGMVIRREIELTGRSVRDAVDVMQEFISRIYEPDDGVALRPEKESKDEN